MTDLFTSPLHERHQQAGAKFGEFSGWLMPLEYAGGGVLAEHAAVREHVGIFDVSHLGKVSVVGPGAANYLNTQLTNDLGRIVPGKAQYQLLCNETGGVVDDLIAYLKSPDEVLLIPNAANCETVAGILQTEAPSGVRVANQHHDYAIIAVQGPDSVDVVSALGLPTDMDYMAFASADFQGVPYTVCRSGYTGERGYELVVPNRAASGLWDALFEVTPDARPCGLGARDTLRTEMGYPLHGQDISPVIDPVSAGLSWAIGWDKPTFRGAEALRGIRQTGPVRRLRGLRAKDRAIPRHGMPVVPTGSAPDADPIGEVTSGTFSPTLRQGIGLALIPSQIVVGDHVGVVIRNHVADFEVVKPPFVAPEVR